MSLAGLARRDGTDKRRQPDRCNNHRTRSCSSFEWPHRRCAHELIVRLFDCRLANTIGTTLHSRVHIARTTCSTDVAVKCPNAVYSLLASHIELSLLYGAPVMAPFGSERRIERIAVARCITGGRPRVPFCYSRRTRCESSPPGHAHSLPVRGTSRSPTSPPALLGSCGDTWASVSSVSLLRCPCAFCPAQVDYCIGLRRSLG